MSSSQIYAQITATKKQIETIKLEIEKLEKLLENQAVDMQQYSERKLEYTDRFETQYNIYNKLSTHSERSVIALRYHEQMSGEMSLEKRSNAYDSTDEIDRLMKSENTSTQNDLTQKSTELSTLQSRLTQLEKDYQSALRAEEAERQKQAAAAAAQKGGYS